MNFLRVRGDRHFVESLVVSIAVEGTPVPPFWVTRKVRGDAGFSLLCPGGQGPPSIGNEWVTFCFIKPFLVDGGLSWKTKPRFRL